MSRKIVEVGETVEMSFYAVCCSCGNLQGFNPKSQESLLKEDSVEYIRAFMDGDSNPEGFALVRPCDECKGTIFQYIED